MPRHRCHLLYQRRHLLIGRSVGLKTNVEVRQVARVVTDISLTPVAASSTATSARHCAGLAIAFKKIHFSFSICDFRFVIVEKTLDLISSNDKSKNTN